MTTNIVTISRDPFARSETVRRIVKTLAGHTCTWCGQIRPAAINSLFEYGTQGDGSTRINWHTGLFCSKLCHDSYHG